jgi:hypothetical protein
MAQVVEPSSSSMHKALGSITSIVQKKKKGTELPRFPHLLISQTVPADWTDLMLQFLWRYTT